MSLLYNIILEEDAILHPFVKNPKDYINKILEYNKQQFNNKFTFIYFGICDGTCKSFIDISTIKYGINCYGLCAHSYAITKSEAKKLLLLLFKQYFAIDQLLKNYFFKFNDNNKFYIKLVVL